MKEIKLTKDYIAFVDDEDFERVSNFKWTAQIRRCKDGSVKTVYAHRHVYKEDGTRTLQLLHRFILNVADPKIQVDHRDHNGLHNQRYNLRKSSNSQNQQNSRTKAGSLSGFKGVTQAGRKWTARITINGKQKYLGIFTKPLDAAHAYDAAALGLFGEFANCNF